MLREFEFQKVELERSDSLIDIFGIETKVDDYFTLEKGQTFYTADDVKVA